jgi:alpha-1,2-mannosyltransferase
VTRRTSIAILVISGALALVMMLVSSRVTDRMADFEVYWTAADRARGAEPLYRADDGHYQFKYLPAFAVLATPVSLVPLDRAKRGWFRVSVTLLFAFVAMSIMLLPDHRKPSWLIAVAVVVAMAKFYGHELVLGQVNLLFGVVVLAALRLMGTGRADPAGFLFALAVVVKPYAVIFGPWLLGTRQWKALATFLIGVIIIAALPAAFYGVNGTIALHLDWWRTVTESTAPNLTNADNVSIAGMYSKWFGETGIVRPLVLATSAALLGLAALVVSRRRALPQPHVLEGALLLTLVPLLSPQGWDYVFLVSTPAIALLVNYEAQLPSPVRVLAAAAILTIGLSLYDVMGRAHYATFMSMSFITLCFLIVVGALTSLRLRRIA